MTRATTIPDPWRSLANKIGGVCQLADHLKCDVRTIHRWAHGDTRPDRRATEVIRMVFRDNDVQAPY